MNERENIIYTAQELNVAHGCSECAEVNRGFILADNGKKVCRLCGGKVLEFQEAFDHILELKSYFREITGQEADLV